MNQEEGRGFTWYLRDGREASIPNFTQEETSAAQFSVGTLKNFIAIVILTTVYLIEK